MKFSNETFSKSYYKINPDKHIACMFELSALFAIDVSRPYKCVMQCYT